MGFRFYTFSAAHTPAISFAFGAPWVKNQLFYKISPKMGPDFEGSAAHIQSHMHLALIYKLSLWYSKEANKPIW